MKVLLIDADLEKYKGKRKREPFPNLALMKISNYYKLRGDIVGFNVSDPDIVYISKMFKGPYHDRQYEFPDAEIIIGGPGYDPKIKLPKEIEQTPPDQDLYDNKYSIARVTTGCPRRCHFCMVHEQEPDGIRYLMHPSLQHKPGTVLRLLDDNILAMPEAFWEVVEYSKRNKVKVQFEYLDIRLVTPEIAKGLKDINHEHQFVFAFDYTKIESALRRGCNNLRNAGIKLGNTLFLLYYEDESWIEDVRYRFEVVRELGACPFIMADCDNKTPGMVRIARKANNKKTVKILTVDQIFDPTTTIEQLVKSYKKKGGSSSVCM